MYLVREAEGTGDRHREKAMWRQKQRLERCIYKLRDTKDGHGHRKITEAWPQNGGRLNVHCLLGPLFLWQPQVREITHLAHIV